MLTIQIFKLSMQNISLALFSVALKVIYIAKGGGEQFETPYIFLIFLTHPKFFLPAF